MKVLPIISCALALASPAMAQTAKSAATAPVDQAMQSPPPGAAAATPNDAKTLIAAEFPTYDKDGNSTLSAPEFDAWMVALKEKSGGPAMAPADKATWLKQAFATADADKDKAVTQAELIAYLTSGG